MRLDKVVITAGFDKIHYFKALLTLVLFEAMILRQRNFEFSHRLPSKILFYVCFNDNFRFDVMYLTWISVFAEVLRKQLLL